MNTDITKQMEMVLYRTEDDNVTVSALIKDETIWITQKAMAELFGVQTPAISKHLKNIFEQGELREEVVVSKMEIPTPHGAIPGKTQLSPTTRICVFYDANKQFVFGTDLISLPTLTIPVECAYFRLTLTHSEITNNLMFVKNDTSQHSYVPYGKANGFKQTVTDKIGYILYPNEETPKADRKNDIESALATYGECVLAKGTFYASAITMPAGTKLGGKGMCSRLIMLETTSTGTLITVSGNNTISDLSIEREGGHSTRPNSGTDGGSYGVTCANNVNQIRITNCDFKGFQGAGVYGYGASSNDAQSAFIDNCRFLYCTTGIWFYGGMEFNSVVNCCCNSCYYGVRNEGGNNLFSNCHFDKNYNAFEQRTSSVSPANFGHSSMIGCTFNHSVAYAVYLLGGDNGMVFSGCQIWYGVIYLRAVDGISFSACEFGGEGSVPISFYGTACKGNRFTDCTFNDAPAVTLEGSATSSAYIVNECYMMDGTPVSFAS